MDSFLDAIFGPAYLDDPTTRPFPCVGGPLDGQEHSWRWLSGWLSLQNRHGTYVKPGHPLANMRWYWRPSPEAQEMRDAD